MKKENLKTFTYLIKSNYKLEDLYNSQESKVSQASFIKKSIKENNKDLYFNFAFFIIAFILIYLIIF